MLTFTYPPLDSALSLTMGWLLNDRTCIDPVVPHFSDCTVLGLPYCLEIQPSISTVRLTVGGALSDIIEVFYHTINAEAKSMLYINPPINFS